MIVEGVFRIKNRGTVIQVHEKEKPVVGDTYYSGDDSWKILSVETGRCLCHKGPFFLALLSPIGKSEDPEIGCVLNRVVE